MHVRIRKSCSIPVAENYAWRTWNTLRTKFFLNLCLVFIQNVQNVMIKDSMCSLITLSLYLSQFDPHTQDIFHEEPPVIFAPVPCHELVYKTITGWGMHLIVHNQFMHNRFIVYNWDSDWLSIPIHQIRCEYAIICHRTA
jgi:hypothetical protein